MSKCWELVLLFFCLCEYVQSSSEPTCVNSSIDGKTITLSLNSEKNGTRDWEDTFVASTEFSNSSDRMHVEVKHSVFECDGKRIILIKGKSNGRGITKGRFTFHKRCGTNAAIVDNGKAAQKLSNDQPVDSQVFTNRPLQDNEIFEVKLERKNKKFANSLGFGIITVSPDSVYIMPEMWKSPVTWMYHHAIIHNNAKGILANYGRDIDKLEEGERIGVMRTEFGTLHFFINGVDQGPAASNIPSPVYGIVELWYNAMKVSIIDEFKAAS